MLYNVRIICYNSDNKLIHSADKGGNQKMSVIKKARGAAAALLAAAVLAAGGAGGLAQGFAPLSASTNGYYRVAGKSLSGEI